MPKTQRRRRREAKTDYKARFALLKSEKPRLVIRKTNRFVLVQLVESDNAQDKVIARASSKDLLEKGWPAEKIGSLKSLPAAYLTGFLLVKKLKKKPADIVLDIGLNRSTSNSRLYAAVKGALDAGLKIPHKSEILPSIDRIKSNEKLKGIFERIKDKI